jgi:hypothetical protein
MSIVNPSVIAKHLIITAALFALNLAYQPLPGLGATPAGNDPALQFRDDFNRWDCERCLYDYALLPEDKKKDPNIIHRVGYCYLATNQYNKAEPYLVKAINAGCTKVGYLPSPADLYDRVRRLKGYAPPFYRAFKRGNIQFTVWARPTEWFRTVAEEIPQFMQRSIDAFGTQAPNLDLYIFDRRSDYERFSKLLFEGQSPGLEQNGTGNNHVALFCEEDSNGSMVSQASVQERRAYVMHEIGHALCMTSFGSHYLERVPQWLDEGLADYMAAPYHGDLEERFENTLRFYQNKGPAPTFDEMRSKLYDDTNVRYAVSGLMVLDILKKRDISTVGKIVNTAREQRGDFDSAIKSVTGKSGQQAYTAVTSNHW